MSPGFRLPVAGRLVRAVALLILSVGLVVAAPQTAHACSCAQSSTQEQFDSADVVVLGAVDGPDAIGPNFLAYIGIVPTVVYTVSVDDVFKGDRVGQKVQVSTNSSGASCGWESIAKGKKYIVFASREPGDAETQLRGNSCGGTRRASASATAELIALAGEPRAPDKSIPKPNDPDQSVFLLGVLGATLLIGLGVWRRRGRQSVS